MGAGERGGQEFLKECADAAGSVCKSCPTRLVGLVAGCQAAQKQAFLLPPMQSNDKGRGRETKRLLAGEVRFLQGEM